MGYWKHRKGGIYKVLFIGLQESDLTPVVIYRGESDSRVWTRPVENFMDGRFSPLPDFKKDEKPDSLYRVDLHGNKT